MDRRWRRTRALTLAAALIAPAVLAADSPPPPLRAMRWVAPGADSARAFATAPAECLAIPQDPDMALSVEIGRAAFRTPLLLGGQAARAGLACESCHRSGRDNPDFQFPGASGGPGTADVTLSLFSSHRGNSVHDPRPIPDLSGSRARLKVAPADRAAFIRGLITEEFDGHEPPAAVLAGLTAYVGALEPAACPSAPRAAVTVGGLMNDAQRALMAAQGALARRDSATAVLMIAAARARLGLIDERYAGLAGAQAKLRAADAELSTLQSAVRDGRPQASAELAAWLAATPTLQGALRRHEARSLFNPARLTGAPNRRLPAKPS